MRTSRDEAHWEILLVSTVVDVAFLAKGDAMEVHARTGRQPGAMEHCCHEGW